MAIWKGGEVTLSAKRTSVPVGRCEVGTNEDTGGHKKEIKKNRPYVNPREQHLGVRSVRRARGRRVAEI